MCRPGLAPGRVARSNVVVHPLSAASTPLLDLVHRRAALLGGPPSEELTAITEELIGHLSAEPPRVRRVDGDEPDALLQLLVASEPVHPFDPAAPDEDLADRLAEDRRCFVLEHPSLPGHPMNVVWVALWRSVAHRITDILDPDAETLDPRIADTAVFYSIWNVEPGLVGIPGGTSLLSGAIELLRAEFPALAEFVTLSPIPGFRRWWLDQHPGTRPPDESASGDIPVGDPADGPTTDGVLAESLRTEMTRACARYLCTRGSDGRLLDAVARFHMGNGARLVGLNRAADPSPTGLDRSFGLMANYRYAPEDRDLNRAELARDRPAVAGEIGRLLTEDPT